MNFISIFDSILFSSEKWEIYPEDIISLVVKIRQLPSPSEFSSVVGKVKKKGSENKTFQHKIFYSVSENAELSPPINKTPNATRLPINISAGSLHRFLLEKFYNWFLLTPNFLVAEISEICLLSSKDSFSVTQIDSVILGQLKGVITPSESLDSFKLMLNMLDSEKTSIDVNQTQSYLDLALKKCYNLVIINYYNLGDIRNVNKNIRTSKKKYKKIMYFPDFKSSLDVAKIILYQSEIWGLDVNEEGFLEFLEKKKPILLQAEKKNNFSFLNIRKLFPNRPSTLSSEDIKEFEDEVKRWEKFVYLLIKQSFGTMYSDVNLIKCSNKYSKLFEYKLQPQIKSTSTGTQFYPVVRVEVGLEKVDDGVQVGVEE